MCVVTSVSNLARLICGPPAHDPPNEQSRRLVTVQLILQQVIVGQCVYIRVSWTASDFIEEGENRGQDIQGTELFGVLSFSGSEV